MKRIIKYLVLTALLLAFLNIPLTTRYGIDGELYARKIPLYAKLCGFLYRDWEYRDIVKSVAGGEKDEIAKALKILGWVHSNIKYGAPAGLKIVDDHPLNIIIRQYGAGDQLEDVFTILCSYAGLPAGVARCFKPGTEDYLVLSFVKADDRWIVIDAKKNEYFLNKDNKIASIDDILGGNVSLSEADETGYAPYFAGLKDVETGFFTRAEEQMPARRIQAKIRRWLGNR